MLPKLPRGWKWIEHTWKVPREWTLRGPHKYEAATVFENGHWHTWDKHGVGGENDTEDTIELAKDEAVSALLRQGWFGYKLDWVWIREK